jgi:pyruvate formate-lyase activating enzyme-like uncharacterized protein
MNQIINWFHDSFYIPPLSPACKLCSQGAKMVLLVTGLCPASCYYCPLSIEKSGKDFIFADEWKLTNENDTEIIIKETNLINAKGAGITGGDPLSVSKRTEKYIKILKNTFGESFHIHLYTSGLENANIIPNLASLGLDEIRFHPLPHNWDKMNKSIINNAIKIALNTNMDVAIEIPVIPDKKKEIIQLIKWTNDQGLNWFNLNELEFSEKNESHLRKMKYSEKNDISCAVKNSQKTALSILQSMMDLEIDIGVHYCSSSFKNGVQLKNRLLRRAFNIANSIEVITNDATILKGIIKTKNKCQLNKVRISLEKKYGFTKNDYYIDDKSNQIQVSITLLEIISKNFIQEGIECYISECYPTKDQLEVERIPLPIKNNEI